MLPRAYYYLRKIDEYPGSSQQASKLQFSLLSQLLPEIEQNEELYREKWSESGFDPDEVESIDDLFEAPMVGGDEITEVSSIDEYSGESPEAEFLLSSGSTGVRQTRVRFSEQAYDWLSAVYMKRLFVRGYRPFQKQLRYRDREMDRGLIEDTIFPQQRINPEMSFDQQIDLLEEQDGGFVFYFSNVLFTLAKKIKHSESSFAGDIDAIVCHGEILTRNMEETISEVFDAPVHRHYGMTEVHTVGWGCSDKEGYHVDNESVLLELNRQEDIFSEEVGEVVLTSLVKDSAPVVRYKTGDIAELKDDDCGCDAESLRVDIKGRKPDIIENQRGEKVYPKKVVEVISHYEQLLTYHVAVDSGGSKIVKYTPNGNFSSDILEEIKSEINQKLGLDVSFEMVEQPSKTTGGKLPIIERVN